MARCLLNDVIGSLGAGLKPKFLEKLNNITINDKVKLLSILPEDRLNMFFLKHDGAPDNEDDWQIITKGSPGQRSASMLALVLSHGEEPLVLDQPEDDLDTSIISSLVVSGIRRMRWERQIIIATHNANIPVNGDAEMVIALENINGSIQVMNRDDKFCNAIEGEKIRHAIQNIMEGGVVAFSRRERKYRRELDGI